MSVRNDFYFSSADCSTQLYGQCWIPDNNSPRAIIQIVHGISDYSDRYDRLAQCFCEQGFLVVAEDHLGHGRTPSSDDERGFSSETDGWKKMTDNVHALYERTRSEYPSLPYLLFGHSMGSFLSRSFLIRYPGQVDACILMGTAQQPAAMLKFGLAACKAEMLRIGKHGRSQILQNLCFGAYNRTFRPTRTESDWICSVEHEVDLYEADPLCKIIPTTQMMYDMLSGIQFNQDPKKMKKMCLSTPIFFIAGADDPVGNMGKGVRSAYRTFVETGCSDVSIKLYPHCRHELHNEYNHDEVFAKLLSWSKKKLKI